MSRKVTLDQFNPFKDRTPVQRLHASEYLLITLISFGFSVGATRLFLEVTGYPQLGGGEFHIAHVLWGGLLLFIASLLPLILINRWGLRLSALFTGLGFGLFIDEVGKFITQSNDYFYPAAAPIVYVFILMILLLFAQIRRNRKRSTRTDLYQIFEDFEEVLDRDLSDIEYHNLVMRLEEVRQSGDSPPLVDLAEHLKTYLVMNQSAIVPEDLSLYQRIRKWVLKVEETYLDRSRMRAALIVGLFVWGVWALVAPVGYLLLSRDAAQLQNFLEQLISNRLIRSAGGLNWFEARVLLQGGTGVLSVISAILLLIRSEVKGIWLGIIDLLVILTVVNPLVFYFDQFSSLIAACLHFILFVFLLRYKQRFMNNQKE